MGVIIILWKVIEIHEIIIFGQLSIYIKCQDFTMILIPFRRVQS